MFSKIYFPQSRVIFLISESMQNTVSRPPHLTILEISQPHIVDIVRSSNRLKASSVRRQRHELAVFRSQGRYFYLNSHHSTWTKFAIAGSKDHLQTLDDAEAMKGMKQRAKTSRVHHSIEPSGLELVLILI